MRGANKATRRVRARRIRRSANCASVIALAFGGCGVAHGQCVPNPSQQNVATNCSGTLTGGYTISTDRSPLTVNGGASIQNGSDALTVSIPASAPYQSRIATITVNGAITSSGGNGIVVNSGTPYPGYYDLAGTGGSIRIAANGSVSGVNGINLAFNPSPQTSFAPVQLSLDNAGTISATGGAALVSGGGFSAFTTINNEAGGVLGGVAANFNQLVNNGLIDGGGGSAVASAQGYYFQNSITNNGTIQAEGTAATLHFSVDTHGTPISLTNSGSIANLGSGQAISGVYLTVSNNAGGAISAGSSSVAINASDWLSLVNSGTINGSVFANSNGTVFSSNYVDNSKGTINGNLTFGPGTNTLVAALSSGGVRTGVTGTITGTTDGTNMLGLEANSNITLSSPLTLPANFTQVGFAPSLGATVTLAGGFTNPGTILNIGRGTLTNATTLAGTGTIVGGGFFSGLLTNSGTISSSNLGGPVAVNLPGSASINNSGTISATGDAVNGGDTFINSGAITAGGTAVRDHADGGFTNSGTISSTSGTALALTQICTCSVAVNSGTISGALVGVALGDGILENSGTINSAGSGIVLGYYGAVDNRAGAIISGGSVAIGSPSFASGLDSVTNAGTINGNVTLANSGFGTNFFDAAPGGVLNGNLTLGSGDTLMVDLVNNGTGSFAGINGTVSANNSKLVYNVSADEVIPATPSGFSSVAYQLFNNPTLTMSAGAASNSSLELACTVTVDLNGTIATTNAFAVNSLSLQKAIGYDSTGAQLLTIKNNGTISTTLTVANYNINAALALGSNMLVNSGSISLTDSTGNANPYLNYAAVSGGQTINNSGTIAGSGASAVAFGTYSYPPTTIPTLTNSGSITSDRTTVHVDYNAIINNSGTISSTGQTAIGQGGFNFYSGSVFVNNQRAGTISGSGDAIELEGGFVKNAGTINGNVNLNYPFNSFPLSRPSTYYDLGGTLNGNLTLNTNGALVIDFANQGTGPLGGVTGTINANGASLVYLINSSATTSGAQSEAGFGNSAYLLANNSTLTFASGSQQTQSLDLGGSGSVILNGAISTNDQSALETQARAILVPTGNENAANALTVTNNGTISTTADGSALQAAAVSLAASDTLINKGTIRFSDSVFPPYGGSAVQGGLSVINTGAITGNNVYAVHSSVGTLTNSGTITSNVSAVADDGNLAITNNGTILSTGADAISGIGGYYYNGFQPSVANLGNGVITGAPDAIFLPGGTVSNAGKINGNVNLASQFGAGGYYDNGGTLNGNLILGPGQILLMNYGSTSGPLGGVTGSINANGASLLYKVDRDMAFTSAPTASAFRSTGYQLSNNATLTLASGAGLTSGLALAGTGSAVLNGSITTDNQAAVQSMKPLALSNSYLQSALAITNNGTIATTTNNSNIAAVSLGPADALVNNGSILLASTAGFNDPYASAVNGGLSVTNRGTITGSRVSAVEVFTPYSYVNSRYVAGIETLTNSGAITSDQYGILVGDSAAVINNSGSIASTGTAAIAGAIDYFFGGSTYSWVDNLAHGTISGMGDAIDLSGGVVRNAGTINGNVDLAYWQYGNLYSAVGAYINAGGTLNGNLTLASGEELVTALGSYNGSGFSGISGRVNANNALLLYSVSGNASDSVTPVTGFANVGYLLSNNATLTLATDNQPNNTLLLSGSGAVNINTSIATTDVSAVSSLLQPVLSGAAPSNLLTITNNGTLATNRDNLNYSALATVRLGATDSLINNGSVTLTNTNPYVQQDSAVVSGGQTLINSGTIAGTGVNAVDLGTGTGGTLVLTNSGKITSDQVAVQLSGPAIVDNSGSISGAQGGLTQTTPTVHSGGASTGISGTTLVVNRASGVISGTPDAVDLQGGAVDNAGTINGNVSLGYVGANATTAKAAPGVYIADGGTLNGNLTFISANGGNELVETGAGLGVNGKISSGPGVNFYGHLRNGAGTVMLGAPLPDGFAVEYTVANGTGTSVTVNGPVSSTANIYVGGQGTIINQANTTGLLEGLAASGETYYAGLQLASLTNQAKVGGINISASSLVNTGTVGSTGSSRTVISQDGTGALNFTNSGTVLGGIAIKAANYSVIDAAGGAIVGNIAIDPVGAASGRIALAGAFAGNIDGGAGATTGLEVSGGSATMPVAFGNVANVASYTQTGGYSALVGTASLGTAAINGGTFVGLVGSIINASQINVGSGGTFASGGTINGNLSVSGTLHVGASPDTLTVNGNVTIASGSTSLFEVSPAASSKLIASGSIAIGSNASLQIIQLQPLSPGTQIDLLQAAGGVSGNFATLTGINGALVEKNGQLSVRALFNAGQSANPQVGSGVTYLNDLIANGIANRTLLAALPALQSAGGVPSTSAFARLTPEPYASATQIGVENALVLSRAVREFGWDGGVRSGSFTFGKVLGNWGGINGNAALGTSRTDLSGDGFIGGIGIGSETASIAGFGGYLNQAENIDALAASTHAGGFLGGVTGRLTRGAVHLDVSLIYDGAHANTHRLAPDAMAVTGSYGLNGWTLDGEASTSLDIGSGFGAKPHIGATWVWTRRSRATEDNTSPFALNVAGDHHRAGFIDGGIRFEREQVAVGQLSPYLDLGLRYEVEGRDAHAVAGLGGGPAALYAYGVKRRAANGLVAGGALYRASDAVSLMLSGSGQFSKGDNSGAVTGQVEVHF